MPKLKYLWAYKLPSEQKSIWNQKCPHVVYGGDENCQEHYIASPYEFGGWLEGKIWEIPCKGLQFEDPYEEEYSDNDSLDPSDWPYDLNFFSRQNKVLDLQMCPTKMVGSPVKAIKQAIFNQAKQIVNMLIHT